MTTAQQSVHHQLPSTLDVRHPARLMLHGLRPAFAAVAHRRWDLEVLGAENVPARGPVVTVGNHIGFLDGPLMAIVGPRPVHALTKSELFSGPLGAFLTGSGQIPTSRDEVDPAAIKSALRVLREGGVAGVFPERTRGAGTLAEAAGGAAYLALVTGAPVVPMAFLGTRLPGSAATFPPAGVRIVVSHGSPLTVEQQDWPRRSHEVAALTERIRLAIIATVQEAVRASGVELPGDLPETDGTSPGVGPASERSKEEQ
ncbi:lysophospholipid acyltransferase family protein [Nocardioides marmorisolisilvae]|uniref:1-acyl-sn-glycerol-3-phosphate acyltransferase n=1 Tax=Nocardioides marmorisolisilvae TaxID=1542737 RepID=A0A3N0DUL5_9ACTN|nr:lysophospholipid acyltransferase family protein [Nocardioides marmorisolisilvae]RNL79288.1 1-acyl-sn-glycerol-3-phosphate acyltransferase [Nocardioides marmorisolisilvae]